MKTSNKILLSVSFGLIGLALLPLIALRITMDSNINAEGFSAENQERRTASFQIGEFSGLEVEGNWDLYVTQGNTCKVEVNAPEKLLSDLLIENNSNQLHLGVKKKSSPVHLKAVITMPLLSELTLGELVQVHFSGFTNEQLTIESQGYADITGTGNMFQAFVLKGNGVLTLDLLNSLINNADLRFSGVFNIDLSLNGGTLSGGVLGIGGVHCKGDVKKKSLTTRGPAWLDIQRHS